MTVHFDAPRIADRIHPARCACRRCRPAAPATAPQDPRERPIRAIMFALAILTGGTLGHLFTPQTIAAAIAAVL